jgi:hypothetical protein
MTATPIRMLAAGLLLSLAALTGCDKTGSCESTQLNDPTNTFCVDEQKKSSCEEPSKLASHSFDTKPCSERGYQRCGNLPMMLKSCPNTK